MGDANPSKPSGDPPAGAGGGTQLESAEEVRCALDNIPVATLVECLPLATDAAGIQKTRLESVEHLRAANPASPPATLLEVAALPAEARPATRLESVEEIRRAVAEARSAVVPAALPYRPALRPPMAILIICDDGKTDGEQVRLREERTIIGRAEGAIRIPHDGMMSSRHAEIVRDLGPSGWTWSLVDLQSANGSFIRVAQTPLLHKAEILIGSTVLRFEDAALNLPGATPTAEGPLPTKTQGWQTFAPTDLKASLVQVTKEGLGKRYFLDAAEQWIGRDPNQAVISLIDDVQVNPRHAKVAKDAKGNWSIVDAGSLNEVWLRIERHAIDGSCAFQLGEQRFIVRMGP